MTETEIWKDIPGYENRYQASTWGNIRRIYGKNKPYVYTFRTYNKSPYYKVTLYDKDGVSASCRVHTLIYITFYGPIPAGFVIDHISGIKTDNSIENLRAVSAADNCRNPNTIMNYRNRNHSPEEHAHRSAGQKRRFQRPEEREHILRIAAKGRETARQNREQKKEAGRIIRQASILFGAIRF